MKTKILSVIFAFACYFGSVAHAGSHFYKSLRAAKEHYALNQSARPNPRITFQLKGEAEVACVGRETGDSARLTIAEAEIFNQNLDHNRYTGAVVMVWDEGVEGEGKNHKPLDKEVEPPVTEVPEPPQPTPPPAPINPPPPPQGQGFFGRMFSGTMNLLNNLHVTMVNGGGVPVVPGGFGIVQSVPIAMPLPVHQEVWYERQPLITCPPRVRDCEPPRYYPQPQPHCELPRPRPTPCPRPASPCIPTGPRESNNGNNLVFGNGNNRYNQGGGFGAGENRDPRGVLTGSSRSRGGAAESFFASSNATARATRVMSTQAIADSGRVNRSYSQPSSRQPPTGFSAPRSQTFVPGLEAGGARVRGSQQLYTRTAAAPIAPRITAQSRQAEVQQVSFQPQVRESRMVTRQPAPAPSRQMRFDAGGGSSRQVLTSSRGSTRGRR